MLFNLPNVSTLRKNQNKILSNKNSEISARELNLNSVGCAVQAQHKSTYVSAYEILCSGTKDLIFGQSILLLPSFVCGSSKGSGETA